MKLIYRLIYLQAKSNAHSMKGKSSFLLVFLTKIFSEVVPFAELFHRKYHQNWTHKISWLKCHSQSKYFSSSSENRTKKLLIWRKFFCSATWQYYLLPKELFWDQLVWLSQKLFNWIKNPKHFVGVYFGECWLW